MEEFTFIIDRFWMKPKITFTKTKKDKDSEIEILATINVIKNVPA